MRLNRHRSLGTLVAASLVLLLSTVVAVRISRLIAEHGDFPFDTDEATHALSAQRLGADVQRGDMAAFRAELYSQATYPPLAALMRASLFLAIGTSSYAARLLSLICLIGSAWVVFFIALELEPAHGWFTGLLAASLTLTGLPYLLLASLSMLEMPGLMVSMVALWAYLAASNRDSWVLELGAGCALAAVMLTKYPFGVVTSATIVVHEIVGCVLTKRVPLRRWLLMSAAFLAPMVYWFWEPWKIGAFTAYATLQPHRTGLASAGNLLYYPKTMFLQYLPSPAWGLLGVAGIAWAVLRWRRQQERVLLLYFAIALVMLTLKTQNEIRFIATFVPALYLLTGLMLVDVWRALAKHRPSVTWQRLALVAFCVVAAHGGLRTVFTFAGIRPALRVTYETDPGLFEAAEWVVDQTGHRSLCVIDPWDQLSIPALRWTVATQESGPTKRVAGCRLGEEPSASEIARVRAAIAQADSVAVLQRRESRWPDYQTHLDDVLSLVAKRDFDYELSYGRFAHDRRRITEETLESLRVRGDTLHTLTVLVYRVRPRGVVLPAAGTSCVEWREPTCRLTAAEDPSPGESIFIDFDRATSAAALVQGWSGFERTPDGTTFVWALGCEACIVLDCGAPRPRRLSLRMWPFARLGARQRVRGVLNGKPLGVVELSQGPRTVAVDTSARDWHEGRNQLVLQFSHAAAPADVGGKPDDTRTLAVAVDWLALSNVEEVP